MALAPSSVFTVIIAGPFIRCATKDAQAARSPFAAVFVVCDYCLYYFYISNVITRFCCYFHCSKQGKSF